MMAPVRMYTTQVCPYCVRAKALLTQRGVAQIEERSASISIPSSECT